ncbi:MAG: hypothetical protein K6G11_00565, partial [Lachnospiraceae bacterium]|nr:hypothetical protein [Lachnospiraceae bacterium]
MRFTKNMRKAMSALLAAAMVISGVSVQNAKAETAEGGTEEATVEYEYTSVWTGTYVGGGTAATTESGNGLDVWGGYCTGFDLAEDAEVVKATGNFT